MALFVSQRFTKLIGITSTETSKSPDGFIFPNNFKGYDTL